MEHHVKWERWCSGRSWEKDLKGKAFTEDKRKRSQVLGGPVRGGAVLIESRMDLWEEGSNTEKEVIE